MVLDAVSNFVRGETDAAVDSTQTTVSVVDASIFPDPATDGEYNVVIWDATNFPRPDQDDDVEILRVTARDTTADELTVTRGQEATSGAAHPSGSAVHLSPTAKMFGDIESTFGEFWDATAQELTADVNNTAVTTEEASITGETKIIARRLNNPGGTSSGTWVNLVDDEVADSQDEFNASSQFVPEETGRYSITIRAVFAAVSDQDNIQVRVRNVTQGTTPNSGRTVTQSSGSLSTIHETFEVNLTAGDTYEVQATDTTSSFNLNGSPENGCTLSITREIIQ